MSDLATKCVVCIGGGPAGLTAGHELARAGIPVTVLEMDPEYWGGISRTVEYKGFRFDIGGHRFFSKSERIEALWDELLGEEMLERPRLSRMLYGQKLYSYPLRATEALRYLGIVEAARCVLSYLRARLLPTRDVRSFEDWVVNQFGRRLFEIFFKTYTEKVWGMRCSEISADWAAQRIQGLSLSTAVWNALWPRKARADRRGAVKTLIDSFRYPRLGPGMLWTEVARRIERLGGRARLGWRVTGLEWKDGAWSVRTRGADGRDEELRATHVVSSMPLGELVRVLSPSLAPAQRAAERLRYRDFLVVALVVKSRDVFLDNWIYVHDPSVRVGRIQNFKSWSPHMVPSGDAVCYGLEYFCFEGDGLWTRSDEDLQRLAERELVQLGLARPGEVIDGSVVRQPKAYPVYDAEYRTHVDTIRRAMEASCPNLFVVGRNGMHRYNNQDHSMMTGLLVAENIILGEARFDPWRVNQDAEYLEEARPATSGPSLRLVPSRLTHAPARF